MIEYQYPEEKQLALIFADALHDKTAKEIIERGSVSSKEEAIHLSQFFWKMVALSAEKKIQLPIDGGSEYWTEKLYNSLGNYLIRAGFEAEWDEAVDKAYRNGKWSLIILKFELAKLCTL